MSRGVRLGAILLACIASTAVAEEAVPSPAASADHFAACIADIGVQARSAGVRDKTLDAVLPRIEYLPRVIELDRRQPEFTQTFAAYYDRRVTPNRVEKGRALLREHAVLLADVQRETGVPPQYIVAFWGLETNFGSYFGRMSVPNALATLACDDRRPAFFSNELVAALKILDAGDIELDAMEGSWAGAMGHMQFMPTTFLQHAVDGDGDGRRDLWGSLEDAFSSAGRFLAELGWEPGWRWGREVRLPVDFDHALAGRSNARSLSEWSALGVLDSRGMVMPAVDVEAAILVPHGHEGPAFVVYDNFEVIMRWNRSEYYALSVGRLADRISGAGRLDRPAVDSGQRLARSDVRALQNALTDAGFDAGGADGLFGPGTRAALRAWQRARGDIADGFPDRAVFAAFEIQLVADREDAG